VKHAAPAKRALFEEATTMFTRTLRAPLALGALILALSSGQAAAQQTITVQIGPVSGSGASGTATITAAGDVATLAVQAAGLTAGASYPVTLHAGTCATPGASAGQLGTLQPDASGRAQLSATTVRAGATGAPLTLTLSLLADGDHVLAIGSSDRGTVACGAIPATAAGARPPAPGGPAARPHPRGQAAIGANYQGGGVALRRR
jgi:hypothetical protein